MIKRGIPILAVLIILISSLAIIVHAKGGSGGASKGYVPGTSTTDCESYSKVKDRVHCRLVEGTPYVTPEPCRGISNSAECSALYSSSVKCYDLNGKDRDKCIRKVAGVTRKISEESPNIKKDYLVLLLYNLEEIIEEKYEDGEVKSEDAADIITDIVAIKKDVLNNANINTIKNKVNDLKVKWKNIVK